MRKNKKYIILSLFMSFVMLFSMATFINAEEASEKNKIIVHFYCKDKMVPNIYYWNSLPENKEIEWPGEKMESEEDNWYKYEFSDVSKINFLFNYGDKQTDDLTASTGEVWYKNGKMTESKPEDGDGDSSNSQLVEDKEQEEKDGANAGSLIGSTKGSRITDRTDFREETVYFLLTTRFFDGYKDNNLHCWDEDTTTIRDDNDPDWRGDFQGLIDKLDYIKALGFSAIWINPVAKNASGLDYHGYHAIDFTRVDPRNETPGATYQDLINACHKKGIKVIQDIVYNHTSNWGEEHLLKTFYKKNSGLDKAATCMVPVRKELLPIDEYYAQEDYPQYAERLALLKNTDNVNHDTQNIYHHYGNFGWDQYDSQLAQIEGDCVDLNTENPIVTNYLNDCYKKYMDMGVDGFRIDTAKHISRLTWNKAILPELTEAAGDNFYIVGEICARARQYWYRNRPPLSAPFYTWKESKDYPWSDDQAKNLELTEENYNDNLDENTQPTIDNALLRGNEYHKPDRSQFSGMNVIDFPMHWNFAKANDAFRVAVDGDKTYNDATWNLVYVDSHDYAPDCAPESERFNQPQDVWAENLDLMFTFRGIPCIYYGSEIEFQKGKVIDPAHDKHTYTIEESGRAYFGDNLEGKVTATDFGEYTASGTVAETLNYPLAQHIIRLNKIRRAIPALQKGQYSVEGIKGDGMAYKRRYTDDNTDSFVCVTISGDASFTDIPNGEYVDAITGDSVKVSDGTLNVKCEGKANMRVYVLNGSGKIGDDTKYLK